MCPFVNPLADERTPAVENRSLKLVKIKEETSIFQVEDRCHFSRSWMI
jgi:hypothetical protein